MTDYAKIDDIQFIQLIQDQCPAFLVMLDESVKKKKTDEAFMRLFRRLHKKRRRRWILALKEFFKLHKNKVRSRDDVIESIAVDTRHSRDMIISILNRKR